MWFKSLSIYQLPSDFLFDRAVVEAALTEAKLKPLGPTEPARFGFVSPFGAEHEALLHESADFVWLTMGSKEKMLPGSVLREACAEEIQKIRERTGKNPGKKQREQIKDEMMLKLLPRAFEKSGRLHAYLDLADKRIYIDSSSDKAAERLLTAVREALGSFAAEPVQTENSPSALMSEWLTTGAAPEPFALGDECQCVDPVDTGCAVKAKRHDLTLDEIREHVRTGKKVQQLALIYDNRLSFVLDEKFKVRKLRFLDVIQDAMKEVEGERDALTEMDTRFTLMALELRRLTSALSEQFQLV